MQLVEKVDKRKSIIVFHYKIAEILLKHGYRVIVSVTVPLSELKRCGHIGLLKKNPEWAERVRYATIDEGITDDLRKEKIPGIQNIVEGVGVIVSPQLVERGQKKASQAEERWSRDGISKKPINIVLSINGLGSNFSEVRETFRQLAKWAHWNVITLTVFLGTNLDLQARLLSVLDQLNLQLSDFGGNENSISIIAGTSKENLQKQREEALLEADLIIANPSVVTSFEAAAAGCPLAVLAPTNRREREVLKALKKQDTAIRVAPSKIKQFIFDSLGTYEGTNINRFIRMVKNTRNPENEEVEQLDYNGATNLFKWCAGLNAAYQHH